MTAATLAEDGNVIDNNEEQVMQCLRTKWRNLFKLEACSGYPSLNWCAIVS